MVTNSPKDVRAVEDGVAAIGEGAVFRLEVMQTLLSNQPGAVRLTNSPGYGLL